METQHSYTTFVICKELGCIGGYCTGACKSYQILQIKKEGVEVMSSDATNVPLDRGSIRLIRERERESINTEGTPVIRQNAAIGVPSELFP